MRGDYYKYWSFDQAVNPEDNEIFPNKYWNKFYKPSLPPHKLRLKVGTPVILMRNLNTPRLCNRTRILLTECGRHVLKGNIMGGSFDSSEVVLYKIPLQSKDGNKYIPTPFTRKQVPDTPCLRNNH